MSGEPQEESIQVCCRFRPENAMERSSSGKICVQVPDTTTVHMPDSNHTFVFDRVFRWDCTQKEVYDNAAKPIINAVLRGFNGTVFAYGQTSSGKTYTMEGPALMDNRGIEDKVYQGIIPRMVWSIFDGIYNADEHIEFLVKVSIVEIYNERIRDLLDPKKDNLKVHEDPARGIFIGDATESYVGCEAEIFDAMRAGHYNRASAGTNMNEHSSRSHLIFTLTIEQKNLHDRSVKVGKLHLVDLAGSEKVGKTGSTGERLDEAKNINRSLSALGNVINALTDKSHSHVPYRDSKLTRVLQESLGGNAKTSLIITCSPSVFNEPETLSTLRFGQRAKRIKNVVKMNYERSAEELKLLLEKRDRALLACRNRIAQLEQFLRSKNLPVPADGAASPAMVVAGDGQDVAQATESQSVAELMDQLQDKRAELKESAERITELNRERDDMQRLVRASQDEKQLLQNQITTAKSKLINSTT
jgi:kinesin family protein 5